ncbi:hypothetical protein CC78DRAFT_541919 [Lojkania enalia]|uniref:DUF6604 domain-containing protein n=1 Tax=Lojkania enalia TaxID=147567 RepID=A0A9P4N7T1_9PLEO|nr:hypothetical protein CC78DRAFT_541919 [Didymosphaeria enalia]
MLPSRLRSSYGRYKDDLNYIAWWLATTAMDCGYIFGGKSKKARQRRKRKEKMANTMEGEAEGEGKEQSVEIQEEGDVLDEGEQEEGQPEESQPEESQPEESQPEESPARNISTAPLGCPVYPITSKELVPLAKVIAEKNPFVQVPSKFATVLERAIAIRKWFACGRPFKCPEIVRRINLTSIWAEQQHHYVLQTLQLVHNILMPRLPNDHMKFTDFPENAGEVLSMFANFELDDIVPTTVAGYSDIIATEMDGKFEHSKSLMEGVIAIYLHLADLDQLRSEVRQSWETYKQGGLDLCPAAITTNTAVDIARAMEDDLKGICSAVELRLTGLVDLYVRTQCECAGTTPVYTVKPDDKINFLMYGVHDYSLRTNMTFLYTVIENLKEGKSPCDEDYDLTIDWFKLPIRDKYEQDRRLVWSFVPEIWTMCLATEGDQAEDEFTRGIRLMQNTDQKDVPLWLAFAASLFLDLYHILKDQVESGFWRLKETAAITRNNIRRNRAFHANLWDSKRQNPFDEILNGVSDEIRDNIQYDVHRMSNRELAKSYEPFYFLRRHPWYCGIRKFGIHLFLAEYSVAFANASGSILYCGHLYRAALKEKLLSSLWPDMELAFSLQGKGAFFLHGNEPDAPGLYVNTFNLIGRRPVEYAEIVKPEQLDKSMTLSSGIIFGPRGTSPVSFVLWCLRHHAGLTGDFFALHDDVVEQLIADYGLPNLRIREDGIPAAPSSSDDETKKPSFTNIRPDRFLASLRSVLQLEMLPLQFDYLMFHRVCRQLLENLKDELNRVLIDAHKPKIEESDHCIARMVKWYLLMLGLDVSEIDENVDKMAWSKSRFLGREYVSKVLQQMLTDRNGTGRMACDHLRSVKLPIDGFWDRESGLGGYREQGWF